MCRKNIASGRGDRGGGRYSRIAILIAEPSHPISTPALRLLGETGAPLGFPAR